jgi:hypothetical protein
MGNIDEIMDIYLGNKGRHLNTMEKYCTYLETKGNNQINDKSNVNDNSVFNTIVQYDLKRGQHHEPIGTFSM